MQVRYSATSIIMAMALCWAGGAFGQEEQLKELDLPDAVQKTVSEQSKGATVKGYRREPENGVVAYEVALIVNGHSKDITMDGLGNVTEVEEEIDMKTLPVGVREGLQKQAGKAGIGKVESLTKRGTLVAYEAQIHSGKKHSEIQVGPDGKSLDHKE
jgi:hypothetical protein